MAIDTIEVITLLIVLTAAFSYINFRFIRLPPAIGVMLISLLCSLVIVIVGTFYPSFLKSPVAFVRTLDFESLLMRIMLSFLLFAGAIHIDLQPLKHEMAPIISF